MLCARPVPCALWNVSMAPPRIHIMRTPSSMAPQPIHSLRGPFCTALRLHSLRGPFCTALRLHSLRDRSCTALPPRCYHSLRVPSVVALLPCLQDAIVASLTDPHRGIRHRRRLKYRIPSVDEHRIPGVGLPMRIWSIRAHASLQLLGRACIHEECTHAL